MDIKTEFCPLCGGSWHAGHMDLEQGICPHCGQRSDEAMLEGRVINVLNKMTLGTLPKELSDPEIEVLERRFGRDWLDVLGYGNRPDGFSTRTMQAGTWVEAPREPDGAAGKPLFLIPKSHNDTELAKQIAALMTKANVTID